MPEYFDSTSSKPKKTKKTRYAGGGSVETYNAQIQRKYHGGSVKRKQAGGGTSYPGGIAGMKKTIAEIEGMDPAWTGSPSAKKMVFNIAKQRRKNRPPSKTTKRVPGGNSAGGSVTRKQAGSKLPMSGGYPGGIAGMKKHIAELEKGGYQGDSAKLVRQIARQRRENVSSGLSAKYGVKRKPKLKGKTKRGTSGDD